MCPPEQTFLSWPACHFDCFDFFYSSLQTSENDKPGDQTPLQETYGVRTLCVPTQLQEPHATTPPQHPQICGCIDAPATYGGTHPGSSAKPARRIDACKRDASNSQTVVVRPQYQWSLRTRHALQCRLTVTVLFRQLPHLRAGDQVYMHALLAPLPCT